MTSHTEQRGHILEWAGFSNNVEPDTPEAASRPPSPVVSVIVPTYNRPLMLKAAVQSILAQTFQDFEIIVVNDAGEDVASIVNSFGSEKIRYLSHQTNRGLAAARNTGLRAARGRYIAYLDDDDMYYPEHLKMLVTFLQGSGEKVAYTDAFRAHQEKINGEYKVTSRDVPYSFDFDYDAILTTNFVPVLCFMHERSCVEKSGEFDESLKNLEDWDMWIRMSREFKFSHIKKLTCEFTWRTDGTTMTSAQTHKYAETREKIIAKYAGFRSIGQSVQGSKEEIISARTLEQIMQGLAQLREIGKFQEALVIAERLVEMRPSDASVWNEVGVLLFNLGRAQDAVDALQEAVKCSPEETLPRKNLVDLLVHHKQFDDAEAVLADSIKAFPKDVELLHMMAVVYKMRGKEPNAQQFDERAALRDVAQDHNIMRPTIDSDESEATIAKNPKPIRLSITYLINNILGVTGGNQTLLHQVNAMAARGHTMTIVTNSDRPAWLNLNARVIKAPSDNRLSDFVPLSDVVVSTYFSNTAELQRITAPAKIYFAQGDQFVFEDSTKKRTKDPLQKQLMAISKASYLAKDVIFVPNSTNLATAVERKYGRKADAIVPISVDTKVYHPIEKFSGSSRARILVVGPDIEGSEIEPLMFKGIKDIRKALEILSKKRGDFDVARMSNSQPAIFKNFPCEFHFVPTDEMKTKIYGTSDILVYASHYDSCPLPPMEAMAAGVAVVCTATAGALEYCRDRDNCLLVPIKSPEKIARAIEELMDDKDLREKLIRNGLETATRYTKEIEWDNLERIFYKFVKGDMKDSPMMQEGSLASHSTSTNEEAHELLGKDNSDEQNDLAVMQYKAGDKAGALNRLQAAEAQSPGNLTILRNLADLQMETGDQLGALATCSKILVSSPDDVGTLFALGSILLGMKLTAPATEFFGRVKQLQSDYPQIDQVIDGLREIIDRQPKKRTKGEQDAVATEALGRALQRVAQFDLGRAQDAVDAFKDAIKC